MESASYLDKLASTAGLESNLEDYWLNKLSGDPGKTGFPYDNKKIDAHGDHRSIEEAKFQFTAGDYEKLIQLSNGSHPRLHMILIAGLVSLLFKYSSNKDIIVGTSIYKQDIEGEFINTVLALRNQLQDHITFKELLLQVRQVLAEALENQNYPIELLLQKLGIPFSKMDDFPLFDTAVLLGNIQDRTYIRHINPNMFFFFLETGESVEGVVAYNSALYKIETINRICIHFKQLLHQVLFNVDLSLANIDILTDEEKRQLLVEFNDTEGKYPKHKSITGLFQQQVGKTPDHIAVVYKDNQTSYKELNEKSHRLSMILRKKGAAADTIVGLMAAPSLELIIGILGILKAGAAYLPLDQENPGTRIEFILKDSNVGVLVTTPKLQVKAEVKGRFIEIVDISDLSSSSTSILTSTSTCRVSPTNLAYIIYTSGTTGKPKGVIIDHQGLVNYTWWAAAQYVKNKAGNFPLFTSISFDLTITSIFTPLITGNAIVVYGNDDEDNVMLIEKIIDDNKVEAVKLTPSHLRLVREKRMNSSAIKCFIVGGEELDAYLAGDISRNFNDNIEIYNEYGPTETVVGCMCYRFNRETDTDRSVSIGIPINNMRVYILDIHRCPVPPGAVGELYVSGDGVARGYLNNPELTAEKFLSVSYKSYMSYIPKKIYKTGDLARWLADGNIEFLGRIDHQVKIRGYRIELGEIESLLLQYDKIKEAIVTVHGDNSEDRCLCAYVVPSGSDPGLTGEFDVSKLKAHLAEKLPEYMLPSFFINLRHLPLTPGGKIDRKNLPGPEIALDKYVPPGNESEEKLVGIWSEVLKVKKERIGINSSFFDLGGSSLKATLLVSRIHKAFNTRVSLLDVFKTPTIEELSKIIIEAGKSRPSPGKTGAWSEEFISIRAAEKKEYDPASSAQKRLYILRQMEGQRPVYNITLVMELLGELDSRKLEGTIRTLTRRHESLRTSFRMMEENLVQQIHDRVNFSIRNHESARVERIIREFSTAFDLSQAPLLRVGLVKMNAHQRVLIIEMHHIISDGISVEVFARESMKLYSGEELPPLKLQYRDFSEWRNSAGEKQVLEKQGKYWAKEFEEEPPGLDLPYDYPRPLLKSFEGSTLHFQMGKEEIEKLKKIASDESVTLYMILLAIYTIFLSKLCSQEEIVVGTPVAGRRHAELQEIIGVFINTLALGNRPAGEKTFPVFLKEVKNRTLEAFENQDYPFEELVDNLVKNRDTSRNPLFDVMFILQDTGNPEVKIPALKLTPFPYETQISRFELMLYAREGKEMIFFQFDYSTALFKKTTIERFVNYLKKIVAAIIENPGIRLGNIGIITAEEKQRVLYDFNHTDAEYPREMTLHELFVRQVEQRQNHMALIGQIPNKEESFGQILNAFGEMQLTYSQLNERSNQLAYVLIEKGVQPDTIVGIMLERSPEMIAAILGILKAGAAYMPIDPDYPPDRINYMLADSDSKILVTRQDLSKELKFEKEIIYISDAINRAPTPPHLHLSPAPATCLAYIIYTSGSTGRPKGVLIEHRHVVRLMFNDRFLFDFGSRDVWTLFHSFCFDFSVWEMYGALLYGGKLVLIPRMIARDPEAYLGILKKEKVTVVNQTPSAFYNLITAELNRPGKNLYVKYVIFGGEALSPIRLKEWKNRYPQVKLINMYGITETTVHVTFKELCHDEIEANISNIGKPIPTLSTYVMDKDLKLLPIGVPGELSVGGLGVARGYLNRPQLTGEKFPVNPYKPGEILYRSGDLVRLNPDGEMEYLGRIDQQVKIRGFRIELEEIENQLLDHKEIKEAVVIFKEENHQDRYLCAYFVSAKKLEVAELREYLSGKLPDYMIPSYFVPVDKIPLTANGKLDRKALPDAHLGLVPGEYEAPADWIEEKLLEIWGEVLTLKKGKIGTGNNFFQLGGHSLNAITLVVKIHKELNVKVPLTEVFVRPTIRALAGYIKGLEKDKYKSIESVPQKEYHVLSHAQKRLYILQQINLNGIGYNMPNVLVLEQGIDVDRLEAAFKKLVARHDSLRTSFPEIGGEPVQRIHKELEFKIEYYDLHRTQVEVKVKVEEKEGTRGLVLLPVKPAAPLGGPQPAAALINSFIRPFDLARAPLLRVGLIKESESRCILMFDMHHIITDGISQQVLTGEFVSLYTGQTLPPLKLQYKDYSEWQNSEEQQQVTKTREMYWLEQFQGEIPVLNLPTDYARPGLWNFEGSILGFAMGKERTRQLKELSAKENTTLYMVLMAIFNVFLARLSSQEDVVVGTPVAGRRHSDLLDIIGIFVNTLALRNYPTAGKSFSQFLQEIKKNTLEAFENQEYPFEVLVEKVAVNRDTSRNPLFDVMLVLQNIERQEKRDKGTAPDLAGLNIKPYELQSTVSKFDLTFEINEKRGNLFFNIEYSTKLFKTGTIQRFISYLKNMAAHVIEQPGSKISEIEILPAEEKKRILVDFNLTQAQYLEIHRIHELFEEQARKTPNHIAVVREETYLTYTRLNREANQLAKRLKEKGAAADTIVAIRVERSIALIIGLLAILKADAAYLPIDPEYPQERIRYMLADSNSRLIIKKSEIRNPKLETNPNDPNSNQQNKKNEVPVLDFEHLNFGFVPNFEIRASDFSALNLAYIIYTSGTTGRPKGVMTRHRGLVNMVLFHREIFGENPRSRISQVSSLSFDAMGCEVWPCLLAGACLCIADNETRMDPGKMKDWLIRNQVTISFQSTLMAVALLDEQWSGAGETGPALEILRTAGDRLMRYPSTRYPFRFYNLYGPTEDTIWTTWAEVSVIREPVEQPKPPPIGKPVANHRVYILSQNSKLQPLGVTGELCISGLGLARGYLNQPELTAEKFCLRRPGGRFLKKLPPWTPRKNFLLKVPDKKNYMQSCIHASMQVSFSQYPITPIPHHPIYRTGDLARWLPDGNIEFLGRKDHQVKIRGFRIELEEIENQLLKHAEIKEAVVIEKEITDSEYRNKSLCACIIAGKKLDITELNEFLAAQLPDYMIPVLFVQLEQLPLTSHGKVDRKALQAIDVEPLAKMDCYQAPRNPLEKKLVEIWQRVLGRKTVGINDNFFMLGGDSIKTIQISSRINRLGYKIAVNEIFQNPTISQLSPLIKKIEQIADQKTVTGIVPLTPIQQRFFENIKVDRHHYNQAVMFYSKEGFEQEAVKAVFFKVQEHHDALRIIYKEEQGKILQLNRGLDFPPDLQVFDYRKRKDAAAVLEEKANQIQASIDLKTGPLMKLALFHLDDGDRLLIVIHHLVIDGVSWRILFEDIETLYRQYKKGEPLVLPQKTDSFKTWAEELSQYANSQSFLKEKTYWVKLASDPPQPIKKDFEAEVSTRKDTETLSFHLDKTGTRLLLTRVNKVFATEINDVLLTAFGLGIKRTFGNKQVLIAMEGHGREEILADIDIKRTLGWFTTVYPVLLDLSYENAGNNLSRQVKEVKECFRRVPHNGIGYGILKYLTAKKYKKGIGFKLQPPISFNYLGQFDADVKQMSFAMARESFGNTLSLNARTEYEFDVSGMIADNRLVMSITYSKKQYKKAAVQALSDHYREALMEIISYCSTKRQREFTPSDFTYPGLSIDLVDRLQRDYYIEDIYTLAPLQEGMLFHSLYEEHSPAYFLQTFYRLHGDLDISLVKRSFNELVKRHEVLRTLFVHKGAERPIQVVLKEREIDFHYKDLRKISGIDEKEQLILNYREEDRQRPFELSRDNPTRITVLQLEQDLFELIWSHHHILMDGWCRGVLMTEYLEIYNSLLEKRAYQLPGITPYRAYIQWLEKQPGEKAREYWRQYLEGYEETTGIPGMKTHEKDPPQYRIEEMSRTWEQEKHHGLVQLSARNQVTLNTVLHTLWGILLGKYNDKQDVVFGTVVSGRPAEIPGVESMVGLFINTLPVRIRYHYNSTVKELLRDVQKSAMDSEPYHYCPLTKIQAETPLKKDLFHHLLVFENYPLARQIEGIAEKVRQDRHSMKLELTNMEIFEQTHYSFIVVIGGEPITIKIQYNVSVFNSEGVANIARHLNAMIEQILEDENIKIKDISLDYDLLEAGVEASEEEYADFDI